MMTISNLKNGHSNQNLNEPAFLAIQKTKLAFHIWRIEVTIIIKKKFFLFDFFLRIFSLFQYLKTRMELFSKATPT